MGSSRVWPVCRVMVLLLVALPSPVAYGRHWREPQRFEGPTTPAGSIPAIDEEGRTLFAWSGGVNELRWVWRERNGELTRAGVLAGAGSPTGLQFTRDGRGVATLLWSDPRCHD